MAGKIKCRRLSQGHVRCVYVRTLAFVALLAEAPHKLLAVRAERGLVEKARRKLQGQSSE